MQRPYATKCIHFLVLALAVACTAASGKQPLEHAEWPTKSGYGIARQWILRSDKQPKLLRPAENQEQTYGRPVHVARTEDEGPREPGEDTEESPLLRQVADEVQQITGTATAQVKAMNGRERLPHPDTPAMAELAAARERLGLDTAAWLVQRWDQHAAEVEQLLHESDHLVITSAPLPMEGDLETLTIHAGDQRNERLRQLTNRGAVAGDEHLLGRQPEQWQPVLQRAAYIKTIASAMSARAAAAAALRGAVPLTNARYDGPSPSTGPVQAVLLPAREFVAASPLAVEPTAYWGS